MAASATSLEWLTARPIAHRGLHDGNRSVPENSLSAFRLAVEAGYAIECDIQRSADGVSVVFHDHDLLRLTGEDTPLRSRTAAELAGLRLAGSQDGVPTLRELLDLVAGRVPLVVEVKGTDAQTDAGFLAQLDALLAVYEGPIALMSFDHWILDQSADLKSGTPLGLTAEGTRADALERHRDAFSRNCSFVSYNVHHLPNSFVDWVRGNRGAPVISWTVRTPDDVARSASHADQMTFEGFRPPAS
ncbi:glycerophosphodiester phosphodiesterase family protein [Aureimonas sp. ME7]|uniref:glycerophosphodiester phosphodiesterase family protein n=1 Tax=Aureimonas sp. ME7 TaxID=2744252 RepID=UPI0015F36457|nr:glycerophosphodiester phosphodiesterase family protein [Aureimonas sp. ME7]